MRDTSPPTVQPLLVDESEARRLMGGLCSKTLFNLRKHGLPFVKIGARTMYDPRDLARWIEGRKAVAS